MRWIDRAVSVEPVLLSALLITLIFVWSRRLTGSAGWAALLALGTAFATMIWPYAYIGLETTQSVFLLAAGWLALEEPSTRSWPRTLAFAISAAIAVSAKSTGAFLVPAVLFLISRYFARADSWWGRPGHFPKLHHHVGHRRGHVSHQQSLPLAVLGRLRRVGGLRQGLDRDRPDLGRSQLRLVSLLREQGPCCLRASRADRAVCPSARRCHASMAGRLRDPGPRRAGGRLLSSSQLVR